MAHMISIPARSGATCNGYRRRGSPRWRAANWLGKGNQWREDAQDLAWALLNNPAFLFNR